MKGLDNEFGTIRRSKTAIANISLVSVKTITKAIWIEKAVSKMAVRPSFFLSFSANKDVPTDVNIMTAVTIPLTIGASPSSPEVLNASWMKG